MFVLRCTTFVSVQNFSKKMAFSAAWVALVWSNRDARLEKQKQTEKTLLCQNFLNVKKRQKFVVIFFLKSLGTRGVFGSGRDGVQTELPCPDAGRQQADGHLPCRGAARTHGLERYQQIRPGHAFRVKCYEIQSWQLVIVTWCITTSHYEYVLPFLPIFLTQYVYVGLHSNLKICYKRRSLWIQNWMLKNLKRWK